MTRHLATETETFIRIVETSSFTAAAAELGIARTVASRHIADLEEALGVRLLNRTTRRVSPTDAGLQYFERAKAALALLDDARATAANLAGAPAGRLRLNAPMSFGVLQVGPAISPFLDKYPDVRIDMTLNDRVVDLVEEGYDLAIRIGHLKDSTLVARRLAPCRMVVVAAPAYLARRGRPEVPEDLLRHECLNYAYASERETWRFMKDGQERAVKTTGRLTANNGEILQDAAVGGTGIAHQPTFIAGDAIRRGALQVLLADWTTTAYGIFAMFPPGRAASLPARAFADHLATLFKPTPPWDRGL